MTMKIEYGPLFKKLMQRKVDEAYERFPKKFAEGKKRGDLNRENREDYIKETTGMTIGYLLGCIAGDYREPSGRVINNLNMEVWYKDPVTGEMEKQKVLGRCEIDHSQPTSQASTDG
jgi:hypothetical protein